MRSSDLMLQYDYTGKMALPTAFSWSLYPLNLFSVNIHVHQKPSSTIFREGIWLGLVYRVRVSFR